MQIVRHPKLAEDIRDAALHYAEISERVVSTFWDELDSVLASIERNPRSHHFDSCGLRRANLQKFPYHLLYEVDEGTIFLVVLRHDRRSPEYGIDRLTGQP
jgi:plasmid stabilization system protein ParE